MIKRRWCREVVRRHARIRGNNTALVGRRDEDT
jgi:hypothetical protein